MRRSTLLPLVSVVALAACADDPTSPTRTETSPLFASGSFPGAIFTTDSKCTGANVNIFGTKDAVHLNGGPRADGAAGLPDGEYFVQVTEPDGTMLGSSVGMEDPTPVTVSNGEFETCYPLVEIVRKPESTETGYIDSSNSGGEYKVWVSIDENFSSSSTKTDNFKVTPTPDGQPLPKAMLSVTKFYDANANGMNDDGQPITGWKVRILNGIDLIRYTPVESIQLAPGDYVISEFLPLETNWSATTAISQAITLADGDDAKIEFGNLCLGEGGGRTKGFWTNRNGQSLVGSEDLEALTALALRRKDGTHFDPESTQDLRAWLRSADAVNMAYMLSAQLAAMQLNVLNGFVNADAIIHAPDTDAANELGYATVQAVIDAADTLLTQDGEIPSGDPLRGAAEALKDALDRANNNQTFVQATPCTFTFEETA